MAMTYFMEKEKIGRLLADLAPLMRVGTRPAGKVFIREGVVDKDPKAYAKEPGFVPYEMKNGHWGGHDLYYTFKTEVTIPKEFTGLPAALWLTTSREAEWNAVNPQFIVYCNGINKQALDTNHREVLLCENCKGGEKFELLFEAWSGMADADCTFDLQLFAYRREVEALWYNLEVGLESALLLDENNLSRIEMLDALVEACNLVDIRKPGSESFYSSCAKANKFLKKDFYGRFAGNEVTVHTIGHTHIDVAWLWTLAHTRKKTARTFATVLDLMDQYPEFYFSSSQPQLYKFIKEDQPELYERIKQRVKEGRFDAEGGMWVEADCNIPSGESLIRQFIHGKRFFKEEFGVDNRLLWLPDVFGYSAALPQIMRKSGIDYFVTSKISWNEYNRMPNDTFMWEGIDGTEILTQFHTLPEPKQPHDSYFATYNGKIMPDTIAGAWRIYRNKDINKEILMSFGYGDGGGGPTREGLEYARRMDKGLPGVPKVKLGKKLEYMQRLEKRVSGNKRLPKWVGELYLELHRGTYTSIARNKRYNRKSEFAYQTAEFISAFADELLAENKYPHKTFADGWECILLNQFHDIIPGSSIKEVYEDSKAQYEEILEKASAVSGSATDRIAAAIGTDGTSVVVFNRLGHEMSDVVETDLPAGFTHVADEKGKLHPVQPTGHGKGVFFAKDVPPMGYKVFKLASADAAASKVRATERSLTNKFYTIRLDRNANISSLYDRQSKRQVLKEGERGNTIIAYEDKPRAHDAWDISLFYLDKPYPVNDVSSLRVVEQGPVRAGVEIVRKFLDSTIRQTVYIYADMPRIDFVSEVDWKETHVLLKAGFPTDVHSDKATYEIQYGNLERNAHWNTSWDIGKFETCGHKWVDVSETGYGVSLLNDCKYGHDIKEGNLRLTLLKSSNYPNVDADREMHYFTYSLLPHAGGWREGGTVDAAYALNAPMYARTLGKQNGSLPEALSMVQASAPNVMVEVVKKGEADDDIIVRLYEFENRRSSGVKLRYFKDLKAAYLTNMLEENESEAAFKGNTITFDIKPYEIKTFRLVTK